jgi:hypothetical protein
MLLKWISLPKIIFLLCLSKNPVKCSWFNERLFPKKKPIFKIRYVTPGKSESAFIYHSSNMIYRAVDSIVNKLSMDWWHYLMHYDNWTTIITLTVPIHSAILQKRLTNGRHRLRYPRPSLQNIQLRALRVSVPEWTCCH